jgi:uncharacterized lipoprotein YmbA
MATANSIMSLAQDFKWAKILSRKLRNALLNPLQHQSARLIDALEERVLAFSTLLYNGFQMTGHMFADRI